MKTLTKNKISIIVASILIVIFASVAISSIYTKKTLSNNGTQVSTESFELNSSTSMRGSPSLFSVNYTFKTKTGETIQSKQRLTRSIHNSLKENNSIQISYLEDNPATNAPASTLNSLNLPIASFFLYLAVALLAIPLLGRFFVLIKMKSWYKNKGKIASTFIFIGQIALITGFLVLCSAVAGLISDLITLIALR